MQLPMINKRLISLLSGLALMGTTLFGAMPALADQAPDKNGPGVTRVSIVEGSVVIQRGDSDKQETAVVNAPLLPGDYVSTGASSRSELQFDGSTAVRLGGNVQARITNDDPNNRQLQLADGTVELGIVHGGGPVAIDTPSVTVRAHEAGDFRISIGKDGSSWVTARRGSAEVVTPQQTYTLESGRTLVARGSASNPSITYTTAVGYDTFDDFNAKRDETMVAALNASPNVNPDIAGYDNLGAYGQWQDVSGYGQSWIPQQTANWSPYGDGSWTWEGGYGWTWVANEPWGWAPYHYGRWYYANGYGWAWLPPAYSSYPAWSPALVGFFGFGASLGGAGWGVSLGFGSGGYGYGALGYPYIGWYPLAPYAPYYPWYPGWAWTGYGWGWGGYGCCGWGWGRNVTHVTNITYIKNIYRHGGVHGVTVGNFQHGTIHGHVINVNEHNIGSRIGVIHGGVPITPGRENLGFGGHTLRAPVTLSRNFDSARFAAANRNFAGRMQFAEQQHAVAHEIQGAHQAQGASGHINAPVSHGAGSVSGTRESGGSLGGGRETGGSLNASRQTAPTSSWARFNQNRGNEERGNDTRGNEVRGTDLRGSNVRGDDARGENAMRGTNEVRANNDGRATMASRDGRSDSWSRFSNDRGSVSAPAYSRNTESYARQSYGGRESYGSTRSDYPSYARSSYPSSYSRQSNPTYSRESNPSYSRQSYPAYSRNSNPSYSRSSYPSYSRGSAPAYRAAAPSYSHGGGGYSAPRSSGGGGGGERHGGGGRPPA